jgi:hypothetical protein
MDYLSFLLSVLPKQRMGNERPNVKGLGISEIAAVILLGRSFEVVSMKRNASLDPTDRPLESGHPS